jgi:CRISPR-associated protein Cas1
VIKRIIEISQARTHLSIKNGQLIVKQDGQTPDNNIRGQVTQIPCEDIGVLLVDHQGTSYTHCVFTELLKCGTAIVLCGGNHHPAGMLLPIESNSVQTERFRQQIEAKEPIKKKLWRQIVRAKIRHQAKLASEGTEAYQSLMAMREKVRSGDPENVEAQASKKFWTVYLTDLTDSSTSLGMTFQRNINGPAPNNMLNYGYMVMRAAIARAICSAGLLPCLGIHHCNRYNAFCLADDILEPFRGFVEERVRDIIRPIRQAQGRQDIPEQITQEIKAQLLDILYQEISVGGFKGPMMVGMHRTAASLARCFGGEQKELDLPEL